MAGGTGNVYQKTPTLIPLFLPCSIQNGQGSGFNKRAEVKELLCSKSTLIASISVYICFMIIEDAILEKAKKWMGPAFDEVTRKEVERLVSENPAELTEAFYTELEFGTGGLRGIMGTGPNRMNKYTVAMATQGLVNYVNRFTGNKSRFAIAYDVRNNSRSFALEAAKVLASNGAEVFIFNEMRPTPLLSFAVRYLNCDSGIVITASHNPKEYNGYKVYWNDGAQIVAPHDLGIISEVRNVTDPKAVSYAEDWESRLHFISPEVEEAYLKQVASLSLSTGIDKEKAELRIAYTALHGTGITMVPKALSRFGFSNVHLVSPQDVPDGNFPTAASPNPEEREALELAIKQAGENNCTLVLATDPDSDRLGIAELYNGSFRLFNGNETLAILVYYHLVKWKEKNQLSDAHYIAKTIVTTDLINSICKGFGVKLYESLTGFKNIAEVIRKHEPDEVFIMGGEESYGYMLGNFTRDKDGVSAACLLAETAAWAASKGLSLTQLLHKIFIEFGYFEDALLSIKREGRSGKAEIDAMMERLRNDPPKYLGGSQVVACSDVKQGLISWFGNGKVEKLDLPKSNVLQFYLADGGKVTARPSGTEPKIKFYFSLPSVVNDASELASARVKVLERIEQIKSELGLH
jgi:phosphoglucomutase